RTRQRPGEHEEEGVHRKQMAMPDVEMGPDRRREVDGDRNHEERVIEPALFPAANRPDQRRADEYEAREGRLQEKGEGEEGPETGVGVPTEEERWAEERLSLGVGEAEQVRLRQQPPPRRDEDEPAGRE